MKPLRLFISSVQQEFAEERAVLREYLQGDPLLRKFFQVFLFEDMSARDRRPEEIFLSEVSQCDIYLGLFGNEYGWENADGYSPTHREFLEDKSLGKHLLIFFKGTEGDRHPKMSALIREADGQLIRRRFVAATELIAHVYASLVDYLSAKELLRFGPFDASVCPDAALMDLNEDKIQWFLQLARKGRGFPLAEDAGSHEVLTHLNLLKDDKPTYAAILLFGNAPQRFLLPSEVKCAHFHGTEVRKPIPFYQVYKGTVFDLVDQAVNFVLSKIDLAVGTREMSTQAPVEYEIPPKVVREAIVNAIAHRDYTSNGSVQVMLFADRLEVWNPGTLPPPLTLEKLRIPHGSVPGNPLLAEPMYLTKYIERMGTGIRDMIELCQQAGLAEPEFSITDGFVATIRRKPGRAFEAVGGAAQPESRPQSVAPVEASVSTKPAPSRHQVKIMRKCLEESGIMELMAIAGRTDRTKFRHQVLNPLIKEGLLEMTVPDKPRSSKQKYRLTAKGRAWLAAHDSKQQEKGKDTP